MHSDPCAGAAPERTNKHAEGCPERGGGGERLSCLALLILLHAAGIHQHLRDVAQRLLVL